MLVLIAGITGNVGQKLIRSLVSRGHSVRGLARNASKLTAEQQSSLESFVQSSSHYDIAALDKACTGVDAIICAYTTTPELQVEGQLLLLRAAERAGVRRYVASSWNMDWRHMGLGQQESYDGYLLFRRQVELTSSIKPIYIFTGVLAEVFFSAPGHGDLTPKNNGIWDGQKKEMHVYGTGHELYHFTTEEDTAEFTAAILERDDAEDQQYWTVCSTALSLLQIAEIYGKARGCEVSIVRKGNLDELHRVAHTARANGSLKNFWAYQGLFYQLHTIDGSFRMSNYDNDRLNVKRTSLEDYLKANPKL